MGASLCCHLVEPDIPKPVTLQIYDVFKSSTVSGVNRLLRPLGTGAFHAGVEVLGQEFSFGFCEEGTGVFMCPPRGCTGHRYREAIRMGFTDLSLSEVEQLVEDMSELWRGVDYDLLHHNCCHFSSALCERLGVGPAPKWVTNLAGAGATLHSGMQAAWQALSYPQRAAIIAKAKAGDIDAKYRAGGRAAARARDLLAKEGKLLAHSVTAAAGKAAAAAGKFAVGAGKLSAGVIQRGATTALAVGKGAGGAVRAKINSAPPSTGRRLSNASQWEPLVLDPTESQAQPQQLDDPPRRVEGAAALQAGETGTVVTLE